MICLNLVLGVVGAIAYHIALGKLWYTHFGHEWARLHDAKGRPHKYAMHAMALTTLVTVAIISCFIMRLHIDTVLGGAVFGAMCAVAFALPPIVNGVMHQHKSKKLIFIDGCFEFLALVGMSAIIALLH